MTSHTGRLYALALALVVFFLAWAVVAARPWATSTADARLRALAVRESALRREATLVTKLVAQRDAAYRAHARSAAQPPATAAAPPPVRVVTLPPLTVTRTS